jgi:Molybdopterin-binding domain of aldehyde dehydrogenase
MKSSDFEKRVEDIQAFGAKSRWRKRGISCVPTKFGISFTTKFLNQAGALVHSASNRLSRSYQNAHSVRALSQCAGALTWLNISSTGLCGALQSTQMAPCW